MGGGDLSIYYKELISQAWRRCPTVAVNDGSISTLSCVATQGTIYGLGKNPRRLISTEAEREAGLEWLK